MSGEMSRSSKIGLIKLLPTAPSPNPFAQWMYISHNTCEWQTTGWALTCINVYGLPVSQENMVF